MKNISIEAKLKNSVPKKFMENFHHSTKFEFIEHFLLMLLTFSTALLSAIAASFFKYQAIVYDNYLT